MRLIIEVTPDGKLGLDGPIDNKMLCVFLLHEADKTLERYHEEKAAGKESRIVRPNFGGPSGV